MTCEYINPSPHPLDLDRYNQLPERSKRLISCWFDRACRVADDPSIEPFETFVYCWFSFNGWASCVTEKDFDKEIIRKVANCPKLREQFVELYNNDSIFKATVDSFKDLWPIFKAQDIRKHDYYDTQNMPRRDIISLYFRLSDIEYAPKCWKYHSDRNEAVPADWPHTIHTIYRVRCNLFHGEKNLRSEMDALIVRNALDVLLSFLRKAEIIF